MALKLEEHCDASTRYTQDEKRSQMLLPRTYWWVCVVRYVIYASDKRNGSGSDAHCCRFANLSSSRSSIFVAIVVLS